MSGLPKLDMAAVDDDKAAKNRAKKDKKKQKKLDQKEKPTIKERGRTFVRQASASLKRGLTPRGSRSIDAQEYAGSESGQEGYQSLSGALGPRHSMGPSEADTHQSESTTAPDTPPPDVKQAPQAESHRGLRRSLSISSTSSSSSSYDGQEPEVQEPHLEASLAKEVEAEVAREEGNTRSRAGDTNDKTRAPAAQHDFPTKSSLAQDIAADSPSNQQPGHNTEECKRQPDRGSEGAPLLGSGGGERSKDAKDSAVGGATRGGGSKVIGSSKAAALKLELATPVEGSSSFDKAVPTRGALQGGSLQRGSRPSAAPKGGLAESVEDSDSDSSDTTLSTEVSEGGTPEQAAARGKALGAEAPVPWKKALAAIAVFAVGAAASERIVKACKNRSERAPKALPKPTPSERSWGFR